MACDSSLLRPAPRRVEPDGSHGWWASQPRSRSLSCSRRAATAPRRGPRCLPRSAPASSTRITAEARDLAGAPVRIRCDESYAFTGAGSDTLGVAFPRAGLAYLDQGVCRALRDLVAGGARGDGRIAEALVVLAHEAVHLRGERREGVTECLALQEAGPLAVRLGLDEERARALLAAELDRRLAERSAIRAAYALPTAAATAARSTPVPRTPGSPSGEPLLEATAHEGDARRAESLAEHRRAERVRLDDDALTLGLERAARHEQRRAHLAAPVLELREGVARPAVRALRDPLEAADVRRDLDG